MTTHKRRIACLNQVSGSQIIFTIADSQEVDISKHLNHIWNRSRNHSHNSFGLGIRIITNFTRARFRIERSPGIGLVEGGLA